jgi:hypothetical protein
MLCSFPSAAGRLRDTPALLNLGHSGLRLSVRFLLGSRSRRQVAHVILVRLSARDIFTRGVAVLTLTPITLPQALPVEGKASRRR